MLTGIVLHWQVTFAGRLHIATVYELCTQTLYYYLCAIAIFWYKLIILYIMNTTITSSNTINSSTIDNTSTDNNNSGGSSNFIRGALLLSIGGLLAKILGALYRIPLTNILGSYGMGLYQLVFPPYILFLTVAQAGVPMALSRIIAANSQLGDSGKSNKVFWLCFRWLTLLGVLGAVTLVLTSSLIAEAQGNIDTAQYFVLVAPALVFVPITNVFKSYFQGNMNMLPSSATTVIEQIVKLTVGLAAASYYMPDVELAVGGAVLAITVSECVSMLIMGGVYVVHKHRNKLPIVWSIARAERSVVFRDIVHIAFPVALGSFVMQLSQVVDSIMVVNLLSSVDATSLYGLWTGPVNSMLGLPIALSAGVAVSALPSITKTYVAGDTASLSGSYNSAIKLTVVIALPCAMGMSLLSENILSLLYSSLPTDEIHVSAILLSVSALSIVFLAVVQTAVSLLHAVGKPYVSVVVLAVSIVVKAVVNALLLPIDNINIYGAAISETLCYLFSMVCVIIYTSKVLHLSLDVGNTVLKPIAASLVMTLAITVMTVCVPQFVDSTIGTLCTIALAGLVYLAVTLALKVFDTSEIGLLKANKVQS